MIFFLSQENAPFIVYTYIFRITRLKKNPIAFSLSLPSPPFCSLSRIDFFFVFAFGPETTLPQSGKHSRPRTYTPTLATRRASSLLLRAFPRRAGNCFTVFVFFFRAVVLYVSVLFYSDLIIITRRRHTHDGADVYARH